MFDRKTQFLQITPKLFDALIIPLNSVRCELTKLVCESFRLCDLTRSHTRPLFVEDILQLHRKDLPVLIELLGANV